MTSYLDIWPQAPQETDNTAKISATIEGLDDRPNELWFRFPSERLPGVTELADPFVTAMIFPAMRGAKNIKIHGSMSRSLLRNLDEFQVAWNCWRPDRYHIINVTADEEIEEHTNASDKAIAAFSGGLDSCFTVWRHTKGDCGRLKRNLKAALMVHGFDIPLREAEVFSRAAENSRAIVESVGLDLIPMACNFREFGDDWEDEHGAALASCLSLFGKGFSTGLVASSHVYNSLLFPWGSNPLTDPMLSSDSFSIVHDSAGVHRIQKAKGVSEWEGAMSRLRVCWQGAKGPKLRRLSAVHRHRAVLCRDGRGTPGLSRRSFVGGRRQEIAKIAHQTGRHHSARRNPGCRKGRPGPGLLGRCFGAMYSREEKTESQRFD